MLVCVFLLFILSTQSASGCTAQKPHGLHLQLQSSEMENKKHTKLVLLCVVKKDYSAGVHNVEWFLNSDAEPIPTNASGPYQHTLDKEPGERCRIVRSQIKPQEWRFFCVRHKPGTFQCRAKHNQDLLTSNCVSVHAEKSEHNRELSTSTRVTTVTENPWKDEELFKSNSTVIDNGAGNSGEGDIFVTSNIITVTSAKSEPNPLLPMVPGAPSFCQSLQPSIACLLVGLVKILIF